MSHQPDLIVTNMLPESTTVLIVGAGPTGLATAISLLNQGCRDIVIVDAVLLGENTSRAMAIHAATLESLDTVGCADSLIQLGIQGKGLGLHNRSSPLLSVDFSSLSPYTRYPYVLILPQNITERVLQQHLEDLGVRVLRPYKVIGLKADNNDGGLHVSFETGEVVKASYVVGADGARSAIRQLVGIGFADPDGTPVDEGIAQMVLADVTFSPTDPLLPTDEVAAIASPNGFFLVLPLQKSFLPQTPAYDLQDTVYRIGFPIPASSSPPPPSPPTAYLQEFVDRCGPTHLSSDPSVNPNPVHISNTIWSTRFRTHAAIADKLFVRITEQGAGIRNGGIILLIGDAAHIHSPAGGLGMNLGIRDAISLGSAIAEHLRLSQSSLSASDNGPDHDKVLLNYASTRHTRALVTIRLTKRILSVATAIQSTKLINLQYWFLKLFGNIPAVSRIIAWRLSGLGNR